MSEKSSAYRYNRGSLSPDVLVVGAGIAGSVSALELAQRGMQVTLVERRDLNKRSQGQNRSEMTIGSVISKLGVEEGVTTTLNAVRFVSLDDETKDFSLYLPFASDISSSPLVAIDHTKIVDALHHQIRRNNNIVLQDGQMISDVREEGNKVTVTYSEGQEYAVPNAVIATGPSWQNLPFPHDKRQHQYEQALVAFAYGERLRGKIVEERDEYADHMVIHPISVNGTGRTSWANSCGDDQIEVIYSDYVQRKDVGKVPRKEGYRRLKEELISRGLIEVENQEDDKQLVISGYFGLEARRVKNRTKHIFYIGERGQYNAATVGDAISPTVKLATSLADIISHEGTAEEFDRKTSKVFNHRLELAITRSRMNAEEVGGGLNMFEAVKWMSTEELANFLRTHKIPLEHLPGLILNDVVC